MRRPVFEVKRSDAAGRLGELTIPRQGRTIETPAMLPVVNPHVQQVDPSRLADTFGAEILITNAYVLYGSDDLRDRALDEGLHDLLDFPGAIMTDSGSFQLAEYGEIDVDTAEILDFQDRIGSDIATPVDIPTPPDVDREQAVTELDATTAALEEATQFTDGEMLVTGPIQGSTHLDLRERAAREAYALELDIYPVGAVVPLLREYRFDDIARIVTAAKRGLGADAPVHLFGAGHPMMFALAVALGCDLFDSAAYALYAREGRYLTVGGTVQLEDLTYLPCHCPVCLEETATSLRDHDEQRREELLAEHNLYVTYAEVDRVKQAIVQGELLELVERRVRAHPRLLDGYRAALEDPDHLAADDPVTGARPVFYLSSESAARPEVHRHHRRLARIEVPSELVLVDRAISGALPAHHDLRGPEWAVAPPFGPVPPALSQSYPLTAELPRIPDRDALEAAVAGIRALVDGREVRGVLVHDGWHAGALETLPPEIRPVATGVDT